MIVTFVIIIYSRDFQSDLASKYGNSTCPTQTIDKSDAYEDQQKSKSERTGLMHCFCSQEFKEDGYKVRDIKFDAGETYCKDWLSDYSINITLVWCMVMVMSMVNVALKIALRMISQFEKRHDKTDLVISNTFKMLFVQFFNTAIIILLVNLKIHGTPGWFPILHGEYFNFTTEWYNQIGVSIILTMMISIISPHIANGAFHLRFFCKRWCDRKCT